MQLKQERLMPCVSNRMLLLHKLASYVCVIGDWATYITACPSLASMEAWCKDNFNNP